MTHARGVHAEREDDRESFRSRAETLQPQLLRSAALHFTQGHDVWQFYREQVAAADALSPLEKEQRTRALYERQLRLPLQQNDLALSEFRAWNSYNALDARAASGCVDTAATQQTKALGPLLNKMQQFEARLEQAGESLEPVWLQYLNFVTYRIAPLVRSSTDSGDLGDDFVRAMYERAVASVCLSTTLWTKYIAFVSSSGDDAEKLEVYERAVRNVSFDASVWNGLLLELERQGASIERLSACFEQRIAPRTSPLMMDQYHFLSVLTTYCDVHRRHAAKAHYDARAMSRLESAFATCATFLETHFPDFVAGATRIMEYQAKCCLLASQEAAHVRIARWSALWEAILERRKSDAEVWMSLFHESVRTGAKTPDEIRATVFDRAMQHVTDYPASVLELWLVFERENGSLQDFLRVQQLHTDAMARAAKTVAEASEQQPPEAAKVQESKKRKAASDARAKTAQPQRETKRAKPSDLDAQTIQTPPPSKGTTTTSSSSAAEKKKSHEALTNAYTLFVSNVSKDVTKEELEALFGGLPGLKDVRLVVKTRAHHVKSRGMAYVQFSDEHGVNAGLAKHGLELKGKAISVERSKPPPQATKHDESNSSAPADLSRDGTWKTDPVTIYVGGLVTNGGDHIGEERLQLGIQQALQAVGELVIVKRVSILKDRRRKPKDYGLVEVASAQQTAACVENATEIQKVLGEQITLKPSRFSIDQILRQQQNQQKSKKQQQQQQGGAGAGAGTGGSLAPSAASSTPKQRMPSLGLMPRALRRKPAMSSAPVAASTTHSTLNAATSTSEQQQPPPAPAPHDAPVAPTSKTNDDFRKLLMKQ